MHNPHPFPQQKKLQIHLWWITACLMAINVALFSVQVILGMDITQPSTLDAIRWGADYAPLTFLAEPYRLFSSMFFHFGLIHLMLNMWALYIFGSITEKMMGRIYFIGLYILAGLMGSLLSGYVSIQNTFEMLELNEVRADLFPAVGAGASGAVMGLGASLTVLSLLPRLRHFNYYLDRKSLLIIMAINLAMGFMISGINNAAHIGGILMGIFLTLIWYVGQKIQRTWFNLMGLAFGIILCYVFYLYCQILVEQILPYWAEMVRHLKN